MILTLNRIFHSDTTTIGRLFIDKAPECWVLEDTKRLEKIKGITRIPAGSYKIRVRQFGRIHEKYKTRFDYHEGTLELLNVDNFSDILIHIGNSHYDTEGCLLLGKWVTADLRLAYSTLAYSSFYKKVIHEAKKDNLAIVILDEISH